MIRKGLFVGVALAVLVLPEIPAVAQATARFFFAGNGHLALRHAYFNTTLDVRYRYRDETYDPAALAQIAHFFRSREDGREAPVPLRLIELLAYVQEHYHPRRMVLLSGFRSPEFNADLRTAGGAVAQASLHTEAMAADITFVGLDMARLWRQLRDLRAGGVGYYRQNKFLHIDTGPPRFWEATTSRVQENLSADNARVFLRTDFDRYPRLEGATCGLHSLTAFPVFVAARAMLVGPSGSRTIALEPTGGGAANENGCFAVQPAQDTHEFRVTAVAPASDKNGDSASASHIVLSTCAPRIGKTPVQIESNRIEVPLD
ncbi:MAG: YcbK family protein [Candidatus Binatia bacterium]